jgi:hypothetical protein
LSHHRKAPVTYHHDLSMTPLPNDRKYLEARKPAKSKVIEKKEPAQKWGGYRGIKYTAYTSDRVNQFARHE